MNTPINGHESYVIKKERKKMLLSGVKKGEYFYIQRGEREKEVFFFKKRTPKLVVSK